VLDPRNTPQGAHLTQLITLWNVNCVGEEERRDLVTLHWLPLPKKIHSQEPVHDSPNR
jgi:hypothetical protein